jgi:hypothetical protein
VITAVKGTCYLPDGTALDSTYEICNTTAPVSMYCHLAFANNGGDLCGASSTSEYGLFGVTAELFRNVCTDQSWTDPACLKLCLSSDCGLKLDLVLELYNQLLMIFGQWMLIPPYQSRNAMIGVIVADRTMRHVVMQSKGYV